MAVELAERRGVPNNPPQQDGQKPLSNEAWVFGEFFRIQFHPVFWGIGVPFGDRSPVLTIPGFTASDASLFYLNTYLRRINYHVYSSGIVYHRDPEHEIKRLSKRVKQIYELEGQRVHIVGHSLGGIVGRGISHLNPNEVRSLSALGSPIGKGEEFEAAVNPLVLEWARVTVPTFRKPEEFRREIEYLSQPLHPGIRTTYYYTRDDGVVHYKFTRDPNPQTKNIEVTGTHSGLVANPSVYRRLANTFADISQTPPEPRGKVLFHPSISSSSRSVA